MEKTLKDFLQGTKKIIDRILIGMALTKYEPFATIRDYQDATPSTIEVIYKRNEVN